MKERPVNEFPKTHYNKGNSSWCNKQIIVYGVNKMQERDDDLRLEDQKERSGYNDWLSDNVGDLKAEYMTQYTVSDLIKHFYWDELSIEDFFNYHEDTFNEYCLEAWDGAQDAQQTETYLSRLH